MVSLSAVLVAGWIAGQTADFDLEGTRVRAETVDPRGFLLQGRDLGANEWEQGVGMITIDATDRARRPSALYGDRARVEARFRIGAADYRIVLEKPGFPPRRAGGAGIKPPHEVGGGVMVNTWINGPTGIGNVLRPAAHAAVVVWGIGRIERDGRVLSDAVRIEAGALTWGYHADDATHRVLTAAREGDTEMYVRVTGIPRNREARGFLEISFDDVAISVNDRPVQSVRDIPSNVLSPEAMAGSGVVGAGGAPGTDQGGLAPAAPRAPGQGGPPGAAAVPSFPAQATVVPGAPLPRGAGAADLTGDEASTGGNAGEVLRGVATGGQPAGPVASGVRSPTAQLDPAADDRSFAPPNQGPVPALPSQAFAGASRGGPNLPPSPPFDTAVRTGVPGLPPGATVPSLGGNAPNPYASLRGFAGTPPPPPAATAATGGTALTATPGVTSAPATPDVQTGSGVPLTPAAPFGTFGVPGTAGFPGASGFVVSPLSVTGAPRVTGFGAGLAQGPQGAPGSAALFQGAQDVPGTAFTGAPPTPGTLAAIGAPTGTGFSSPGFPGSPQPLNAQPASPLPRPDLNLNTQAAFGTPLPSTPAPLNAAPAPLFLGTSAPLSAAPANSVPSAVPGAAGVNPGQLSFPAGAGVLPGSTAGVPGTAGGAAGAPAPGGPGG